MHINLDINVTMRCNAICRECNRGIGALNWKNVRDMTIDDARRIAEQARNSGHTIDKIKIVGGEPTLHKDLGAIVSIFATITPKVWVVTNGVIKKNLPPLPPNARYRTDALDYKDHLAFFASPYDLGMESLMMDDLMQCSVLLHSGRGVEPEGFTQCSLYRTLMKALDKEDEIKFSDEPVIKPDYEVCKHCPISMGSKNHKALTWRLHTGDISTPTESFSAYKTPKFTCAADDHITRAMTQNPDLEIISVDNLLKSVSKIPHGHEKRVDKQKKAGTLTAKG